MKRLLFLEDNMSGIAGVVIRLRKLGLQCSISPDLNAWKTEMKRESEPSFSLLVLDDNLFDESTLGKIGSPNIGTKGGSVAGSMLAKHIRSDDAPEWLAVYKNTPIIIYSVHDESTIKKLIGDIKDVFIFEKLGGMELEDQMVEKCIELTSQA
jgi:hypothetical protein